MTTKLMRTGIAAAALAATSLAAQAADRAVPVYKAPPPRACAAERWQGTYAGAHAGSVYWTANRTDQDEVLVDTASYVQKKWGGALGGQIGYNWNTCNTVWGLELDGAWVSANVTTQLIPNAPLFNININSRFDALLTARARTGIAVDNLLLYVTGGLAAGHFRTTYTNQFLGVPGVVAGTINQADSNQWRWGLAAGFGTEWAWTDRLSIKSEVIYVDFMDRSNRFLFGPPATFATFTESDSAWITRLGLNYKFGDGPVVARY
jgi:outer membrane immunogenic protein